MVHIWSDEMTRLYVATYASASGPATEDTSIVCAHVRGNPDARSWAEAMVLLAEAYWSAIQSDESLRLSLTDVI